MMTDIINKTESYKIIGICMEVHNNLGPGFLEICDKSIAQALNYLSVSGCKVSLIVNFGELSLNYKRIIK